MNRITEFWQLEKLSQDRKAVCGPYKEFRIPATFVFNMPARAIYRKMLQLGGLYEYVVGCTCKTPGDNCEKCAERNQPIPF